MDQATHMQRLRRIDKSLTVIDTRQVDRSNAQCSIRWQSLLLASKFNDTNGHDLRNGKPINEDSSGQVHIHGESIEPGSMEEKKVPDEECKTEVPETHMPVQLRCGHTFGRVCITEWLMSGNSCPMCRAKVLLIRVVLKERNLDLRILSKKILLLNFSTDCGQATLGANAWRSRGRSAGDDVCMRLVYVLRERGGQWICRYGLIADIKTWQEANSELADGDRSATRRETEWKACRWGRGNWNDYITMH